MLQAASVESGWEKDAVFLHLSPSWQLAVVGLRNPNCLGVEHTVMGTRPQLYQAQVLVLFRTTSMWTGIMEGKMYLT